MRKSRFTEEQMVRILREAEAPGASVVEVARKHGVAEQTLYRWRQKFGGMEASDAARLKELEKENARLKKLLAERDLEIEVMKEVFTKSGERARPPSAGAARHGERRVAAPGVRATPGGPQ